MLEAGAAGYVTKDKPEEELVSAVLAVARGEGRWLVDIRELSDPLAGLTTRERDVLTLLARGRSNAVIAETLFVSLSTVRNTLTSIYEKLGVDSGREAVAWAWDHGLGPRK
jgi:DNA-binding NarL/FixJ family response regulator